MTRPMWCSEKTAAATQWFAGTIRGRNLSPVRRLLGNVEEAGEASRTAHLLKRTCVQACQWLNRRLWLAKGATSGEAGTPHLFRPTTCTGMSRSGL